MFLRNLWIFENSLHSWPVLWLWVSKSLSTVLWQPVLLMEKARVTRVNHMHWPVHAVAVFYLTFTQMNAPYNQVYTESVNWCRKLNCSRWLNLDYHSLIINLQHFLYQYQWPGLLCPCHAIPLFNFLFDIWSIIKAT